MAGLLIFDCDGVLVDSELLEHAVDAELLKPFGYERSAEELLDRFVGISRRDMYEVVFAELKSEMPQGLLDEREKRVWQLCETALRGIPGATDALEALQDVEKCVASSSLPAKLRLRLEATGLIHHFAPHIFSTAIVSRGKPAPDIYLHAARTVGHLPEACVVVEDSPHGVMGARAAGMTAIGFTGGSHANAALADALRAAGAALIVSHMRDLPEAIRSMSVYTGHQVSQNREGFNVR